MNRRSKYAYLSHRGGARIWGALGEASGLAGYSAHEGDACSSSSLLCTLKGRRQAAPEG